MPSAAAEWKFWETPELLEHLLPFLDLQTTLNLAKTHDLTRNIFKSSVSWNKLIRRNLLDDREVVINLVELLKLVDGPGAHLLDLLDAMCMKKFPDGAWLIGSVKVFCPLHQGSHLIPLLQFQLLEEVMGAFGATDMFLEEINTNLFSLSEPALSIIGSTLSRQQEKVKSLNVRKVFINSEKSAESFGTVIKGSRVIETFEKLSVTGSIGQDGWGKLASASFPGFVNNIVTLKDALDEGKKEDLKAIWDSLQGNWVVRLDRDHVDQFEGIRKQDGEAGWNRLEQIVDMRKEQLAEAMKDRVCVDGDWVGLRGWF